MHDELEPFRGTYDWQQAFIQNPGEPVYEVSEEQRRRVHGGELIVRPRRPIDLDTGSFSTV